MSLINAGIGVSQKPNLIEAAEEAAKGARKEINGKKPKLLMFFLNFVYPQKDYQQALDKVYEIFEDKNIPFVGGPVIGFFAKDKYYFDASLLGKVVGFLLKGAEKIIKSLKLYGVAVIALESDYLSVGVGLGKNAFQEPENAGKESINEALNNLEYNPSIAYLAMVKKGARDITRFRPINGFLLTPGNNFEGAIFDQKIVEGISSITKRTVRIAGGGLCSGIKLEKEGFSYTSPSLQFFNGKICEDSVISIVFGSDLEIGYGTSIGAESLGKTMFVTKAKDQVVEEIDFKPAVDRLSEIYREAGFKERPMALAFEGIVPAIPEGVSGFLWPVIPTKEEGKKVIFMSPIKEKTVLVLSRITKDACRGAVSKAVDLMVEDANTNNFGFILYSSCPVRSQILGVKYLQETLLIKKALGKENVPIFGLCSAGEIAFYKSGPPFGATATITMMGISNRLIAESNE